MLINTNSKILSSVEIPTSYQKVLVNQKVYNGVYSNFRTTLKGERKDTSALVTIYSSDNSSRSVMLNKNGDLYINGTIQSLQYNYITPTYYDTNGNMEGLGDII